MDPLSEQKSWKCLLVTAGIHWQPLYDKSASLRCDGNGSIVRGRQLQKLWTSSKLLVLLCVCVTIHARFSVVHSRRSLASTIRRQSSAKYGTGPTTANFPTATDRPWSWRIVSSVVDGAPSMWSQRRVPVNSRAAAFWSSERTATLTLSVTLSFLADRTL